MTTTGPPTQPAGTVATPSAAENAPTDPRPTTTFRVVTWIVSIATFLAFVFGLLEVPLMWLPDDTLLSTLDDFTPADLDYRVHFYMLGIVAWIVLPPLYVQLRRPERRVAQMLQTWIGVILVVGVMAAVGGISALDAVLLAAVTLVAVLHPARSALHRRPGFDPIQVSAGAVALVPALVWSVWAVLEARGARGLPDVLDTPAQIMWAHVALAPLLCVMAALLGASDHPGWRFSSWTATVVAVLVGAHSLAFADRSAALPVVAAALLIAWGLAYGALTARRTKSASDTRPALVDPA